MLRPAENPLFDDLASWVRSRGGFVGSITAVGSGSSRGMVATSALAAGELLLRLPHAACLGDAVARKTRSGAAVLAGWEGPGREAVALTAALVELREAGAAEWLPYLATLPARVEGNPASYALAERLAFAGTAVGPLLRDLALRHHDEWLWLRGCSELPPSFSAQDWADARALVTSRQHFLHPYEGTALVPVGDLFNHARRPDVAWTFDRDRGVFEVHARGAVPAGTQLHTSYGAKSNSRLLVHYGFTLAENADDDVLVDFGCHGVAAMGYPRGGGDIPGIRRALRIDGGTPAQRRRGWRQLARLLLRERAELPVVPAGHPAAVDLGRIVAGERAVLDTWLRRCSAGVEQVVERGASGGRRFRLPVGQ